MVYSRHIPLKKCRFKKVLKVKHCKNCWKYRVQSIVSLPNKFLGGSISPKLSNEVYGVLTIAINRFWGSQTCRDGDFCMFSCYLKNLYKKSAEIACKKMLFGEQSIPTWSARKKFWIDFRIQKLLSNTFLNSWVTAETNGVVIRCVDRFLLRQTWAAAHFQNLVLFKSTIFKPENYAKSMQKCDF